VKLDDVRRRVVEEELSNYRKQRRGDLQPASFSAIGAGVLLGMVLLLPADWAKGEWFRPGGWLHDLFGFAGAVMLVRGAFALVFLAALWWRGRVLYGLSAAGASRRRARIAAEQPRFRQPWEQS